MVDIQALLEPLGIPVNPIRFRKATPLPRVTWLERRTAHGGDDYIALVTRRITIELCAENVDLRMEKRIDSILQDLGVEYDCERVWLESEEMFETIYSFEMEEKL